MTEPDERPAVAVEASSVTRSFGAVCALRPTNLRVGADEQVAIMGPSGCGKTSLLNLIGGLDRPDSGRISLAGQPLIYTDAALTRVHREIVGFVFQGYGLIPSLTAIENVEFTSLACGADPASRRSHGLELLGAVGLSAWADRYPEELSGGQRQRVAVARSLAHRPALVLADEPTGNLDHEASMTVIELLRANCRARGAALIVVTHDREVASHFARTVHMQDGRVVVADDGSLSRRGHLPARVVGRGVS